MCDSYSVVWGVGCTISTPYLDIVKLFSYYYFIGARTASMA